MSDHLMTLKINVNLDLNGLCLLIWVESDRSPGSPGNDPCGLNDDRVSSGGNRKKLKQHRTSSERDVWNVYIYFRESGSSQSIFDSNFLLK